MKGLILAGGKSTRLYPLTLSTPKPMVPIVNRPFLEHMIEWLRGHGVREIILTTGYLPDAIRDHFGAGSSYGVSIEYVVEPEPFDTGGAIKNAEALLDRTFFVFNGDILTALDLREMMQQHRRRGAQASISLAWVEDPTAYGVIEIDEAGRILRFREKPKRHEVTSHYINAGTYIFEPQVLQEMPAGVRFSIEREFYPQALARGTHMYGHRDDCYWLDIGTADKYLQAHRDLLAGRLPCGRDGAEIAPGVWAGADTQIAADARLVAPVVMGARCVVGTRAALGPYAVLGDDIHIGEQASVSNSVLWNRAFVGPGATVERCIIGHGVTVPAAARLTGEALANHGPVAAQEIDGCRR